MAYIKNHILNVCIHGCHPLNYTVSDLRGSYKNLASSKLRCWIHVMHTFHIPVVGIHVDSISNWVVWSKVVLEQGSWLIKPCVCRKWLVWLPTTTRVDARELTIVFKDVGVWLASFFNMISFENLPIGIHHLFCTFFEGKMIYIDILHWYLHISYICNIA